MSPSRCTLLFLLSLSAQAQMLVDPATLPARLRSFDKPEIDTRLDCHVIPARAALNLGFRFQTGYTIEVPMRQFGGESRGLTMILRVTPEGQGAEPVWFAARLRVPPSKDKKAYAELSGGYLVGEGKYKADMLVIDEHQNACTANWSVSAKLSDKVRAMRPGLPPGTADDFALRKSGRTGSDNDRAQHTVAILLHASATAPNRLRLRDYDRMVLLSALSSMANRLPARIRLTVFSMDDHKELFHTQDLTAESFGQAVEKLNQLELGKVDYSVLQNPTGHLNLFSRLLKRETGAERPPDAVVVIGPLGHSEQRIPAELLPEGAVPVYNVQLRPWRMRVATSTDTISKAVQQLGGKTKMVYTPDDFAEAIQDVERLLQRSTNTASTSQAR